MTIKKRAYARAGLLGNPSDGYNGKTISFVFKNFHAEVVLEENDHIVIENSPNDLLDFESLADLNDQLSYYGVYGGSRLLKAAVMVFTNYCTQNNIVLDDKQFRLRYTSDIPRANGLGGSSAIIIACLKALVEFYDVDMPLHILASLALRAETDMLKIPAGLQDRVVQAYEAPYYMDFSKGLRQETNGVEHYQYEPIQMSSDLPLFIAYNELKGQVTEVFHNNLRQRFYEGDHVVISTMRQFASIADKGRKAIENNDTETLSELIDQNFDLRKSLVQLPKWQLKAIDVAREAGASAKFAGSGGAIVGLHQDQDHFETLKAELSKIGFVTIKPELES